MERLNIDIEILLSNFCFLRIKVRQIILFTKKIYCAIFIEYIFNENIFNKLYGEMKWRQGKNKKRGESKK